MINKIEKYGYYILLSCIFLLGFLLRLKGLIANPSFWHDECALAWNVIHKNYGDFFSVLRFLQIAPPFFMIVAKIYTQIFGISDFVLRLVPFTFGIASMVMFFVVLNSIFENKASVVTGAFLFAIDQTLINYTSEFKHYSCDVFCTLLCLHLFFRLICNENSLKKIIIYSLVFAISIWFSFVSIFTIAAGIIALFLKQLKEKKIQIKEKFILIMPILISGLLYIKLYLINTYGANSTGMNNYWANGFIAKNLSNFFSLVLHNINYFFFPTKFEIPIFILMSIGIYVLFRKNFYTGLILFLTLFFECFLSWLGFYPFKERVILFLLPIFLIYICAPFELLSIKNKRKFILFSILFITIFSTQIFNCYKYIVRINKPSRGYYARQMMVEMLNHIHPGDIILINQNSNTEFAYYSSFYNIKNEIYQEPQKGNPHVLIKSLKVGKHYWFYMPYRSSATVEDWLAKNNDIILYEWGYSNRKDRLRYVYIKNKIILSYN